MIWTIIISSALGMLCAPTWLGKSAGSDEISGVMLYVIVALIGAEVSLNAIAQAPMYILSGFMILAIHATLLFFVARMLRMNLHLAGIASIANIGSAPRTAIKIANTAATTGKRCGAPPTAASSSVSAAMRRPRQVSK